MWKEPYVEGVFNLTHLTPNGVWNGGSDVGFGAANFDAKRSSGLYKDSKLQVPALQLLACIRC